MGSVCCAVSVTTVGPSLVAMPVWLVCVCVCVCSRCVGSYHLLKLSSFPSLIPFPSLSLSPGAAESLPRLVFSLPAHVQPTEHYHWCDQSSLKSFPTSPSSGPLLPYLCSCLLPAFPPQSLPFSASWVPAGSQKSGKWKRPDDSQKYEKNCQGLLFFNIMGNIVKQFRFSSRRKVPKGVYLADIPSALQCFHFHHAVHRQPTSRNRRCGGSIIWRGRAISSVPSLEALPLEGPSRVVLSPFGILWSIVSTYEQD